MRQGFAFAALLLPLAGCVVPPPGPEYGYPPPGYGAPPAYGAPPEAIYPGYSFNGGAPTLIVEGAPVPLIFYGGGWGYWDGYHRWHQAPEPVWRHLEGRYPGGSGFHAYGGYYGHPGGPGYSGGYSNRYPEGHPGNYPSAYQGGHPGGYPAGYQGGHPGGYAPGNPPGHPGGPTAGFPSGGAPRAPYQPANVSRPPPPPQASHPSQPPSGHPQRNQNY